MSEPPRIFRYLMAMAEHKASDLYLTVGFPPAVRNDSGLIPLEEGELQEDVVLEILNSMLTGRQRREFDTKMELNTALDMGRYGRFRVNVLRQRQAPALVIRRIITEIPDFEQLRLPKLLENLVMQKRGLVLITGMTGSGKSTTLASMIDYRNTREQGHIITIEDPIEYFHEHKKSVITQREVGVDTESYAIAMKNALRQRPDIIMVGEVRDREVMEQALTIAETGHLCLSTIHTSNAYQAIERIVNLFPEDFHAQVRLNLSLNLQAIVSQRLLPSLKGGMVPAIEIMLNQGLVRELILKGDIGKISAVMEQNNSLGMCSFDQAFLKLYQEGHIDEDAAINNSDRPSDMKVKIQQMKLSGKAGQGSQPDENGLQKMIRFHLLIHPRLHFPIR
ncbi:MAG: PilT/PilU family type 4a pilus ATPase [Alphaproteobacteria bacterium]|nr:PilT/PilU family type 4a pilus ATPase [Alphaproteobacteria bacterium]